MYRQKKNCGKMHKICAKYGQICANMCKMSKKRKYVPHMRKYAELCAFRRKSKICTKYAGICENMHCAYSPPLSLDWRCPLNNACLLLTEAEVCLCCWWFHFTSNAGPAGLLPWGEGDAEALGCCSRYKKKMKLSTRWLGSFFPLTL